MVAALLAWLYANTLGNLVASAIWSTPLVLVHHHRLKAHHRRLIDELRAQLRGDDPEG